jgi:recombination protein RecA
MAKELSEGQAWKHVAELFGDEAVFHPEEVQKVDTIRTGSPSLDSAITIGGWPRGRLIQLAGKESSGKTFMAMMAIATWQARDPENCAAFLDAEYTYDPVWAKSLGIDNDRVFLVKSNAAGQIFTGLVGKVKKNKQTGKTTKIPGLLDMAAQGLFITHKVDGRDIRLNLGKLGIIVLDSIAAMETPAESESAVGKQNIALMARFLSVELKKLTPLLAKANVAMIAINQVRINVGQMFGNPEGTSGGRALKHACSLMIEVAPIGGADNILFDEQDNKVGHKVRAKVSKNKLGPPMRRAEFFNDFTSGVVNTAEELLDLGVSWGLVTRPNNRTYVINDEPLTSRAIAIEYIENNSKSIEESIRSIYLDSGKVTDSVIEEEIEETILNNPFMDE